jgi:hypothetical protein
VPDYRTRSLVREEALPLIERGVPPYQVRVMVQRALGYTIEPGKGGDDESAPQCGYCGAYGGGDHGRGCPEEPEAEEPE